MTTYPVRYGTRRESADYIEAKLIAEEYHPEFVARFMAWMIAQGGLLGPGGTRREHGNQPDRPGFAPEGRSFHQPQRYADDWYGPTAIDLVVGVPGAVHRAPKWSEVPEQGSDEAARWGVHCNISTETWHIQPIEIDGYGTWKNQGSPAPVPDYPFPGRHPIDPPDPIAPPEDDDMIRVRIDGYADQGVWIPVRDERHLEMMGFPVSDADLVVKPTVSRAELERKLGYKLTPIT